MTNHRTSYDVRAGWGLESGPARPDAIVTPSSYGRDQTQIARDPRLVKHGLVEARATASGLIDHKGGEVVLHRICHPAHPSIRCRIQSRSRVTRPVHHNERPLTAFGGNLELHVHLADGFLFGDA